MVHSQEPASCAIVLDRINRFKKASVLHDEVGYGAPPSLLTPLFYYVNWI